MRNRLLLLAALLSVSFLIGGCTVESRVSPGSTYTFRIYSGGKCVEQHQITEYYSASSAVYFKDAETKKWSFVSGGATYTSTEN